MELGVVRIRSARPLGRTTVRVEAGSTRVEKDVDQEGFGDAEATIEIPAPDHPIPVAVYVKLTGGSPSEASGVFVRRRFSSSYE